MNFVERYLNYPHLLLALLLLGVVLGIKSFFELPINLFPDANYPKIVVVLQLPGASAEDIEQKVAIPVEKELATLSMTRKVVSASRDGVAVCSVEFEYDKGLSAAQVDVSNALDRIRTDLPDELLPPRIFKVSDATTAVMTIAVWPRKETILNMAQTRRLVEEYIKPMFLIEPAIGDVEVFGGDKTELLITIHRDKLARYGISMDTIAKALASQNNNLPSGLIRTGENEEFIKYSGECLEPEAISQIKIPYKGSFIHLGQIATIEISHSDKNSLFRGNGHTGVAINILRPENGNVMDAITAAKKIMNRAASSYPMLKFEIADTQEQIIKTSVSNLMGALRDAIVLTVAVIFLLMARFRPTLLAAISIPVTYFLTFFLMKLFGMELNIVTMTAVILAVGLLVDDSIVVTENIERHLRQGNLTPKEASILGTKEIMLADLSGTFTTVLVLIPIMFVGGYVEKILRELAIVLTLALCSSYVVSVTIIPLLAPYLLKTQRPGRLESLVGTVTENILDVLKNFYVGLFRVGARKWIVMVVSAIVVMGISMKLVMPLVGRDLMPPMDTGIIKVFFEVGPNTPVEHSEKLINKIEQRLLGIKGFIRMATILGSEPGVISFGADRTPRQGVITAHYVDRFHRENSIWQIEDQLFKELSGIAGLKSLHVFEFGATPLSSISAPVDVMIAGRQPEVLYRIAKEVEKRLYDVKGLASISKSWDFDRRQFLILPDLAKLSRYGLDPSVLTKEITSQFSGKLASFWRIPEERPYGVKIRLPASERANIKELLSMQIPTKNGPIPLSELASITSEFVRSIIVRQDLKPVIDVLAYRRTAAMTHIQSRVDQALSHLVLPNNIEMSHQGETRPMMAAFGRLKNALIISLILLYFSLVPTFRSFRHPVTIMVAIPLSLIGAVWGLLITGRHFCMPASMGMILLSGVVVNNSILLLDFIERARREGTPLFEAIEGAIRARTRPILMTALSTITGMIPIAAEWAIGLERLSPLAVVAIGGLAIGTILTLVYVPLFYLLFHKLSFYFGFEKTH